MQTTMKTMMLEIGKLNSIYPNPQPAYVLAIRASVWMEDLGHLSEEMFLASVKLHRKASKFFPTVADILDRYADVCRNIPKPLALEEPHIKFTPEEEIERKQLIAEFKAKKRKIGAIR